MKSSDTVAKTPMHAFNQFEWLAKIDPAFEEARRNLARLVWTPATPALAVKYREIIAAVILGCRSYPSIEVHLRRAVAEGATLREVLEGFQTAAILGGFPALHYALPYLITLHEELGDKILGEAPVAPDAAVKKASGVARPATSAVSRGMREWAWLDAVDPAYERAHQDLTALVWTPTASALPVKIRELVASVVLAYRAFPTLDGHLRRAVREGASVREAVEAMEVAAVPGGFPVLHYALPFLSAIHDEVVAGTFV
ncbi:MAG: carboxymuconolactone decarboxylase family protein [Betaproteobacteria bacterium]